VEAIQVVEPVPEEDVPDTVVKPGRHAPAREGDVMENLAGACPNCGGPLKYESGCVACALNCGYSECG